VLGVLRLLSHATSFDETRRERLHAATKVEIERWPQTLRGQICELIKTQFPQIAPSFFHELRPDTLPTPTSSQDQAQMDKPEGAGLNVEQGRLDRFVEDRKRAFVHELAILDSIRSSIEQERADNRRQENESKTKQSELAEQIRSLTTKVEAAERLAATSANRVAELETTLAQLKDSWVAERARLTEQIRANADGRVAEFKQKLGSVLARLTVDLPDKTAEVSPDLGRVLLLQLYQLIAALDELGIKVSSVRSR
jgi:hypothetical protein